MKKVWLVVGLVGLFGSAGLAIAQTNTNSGAVRPVTGQRGLPNSVTLRGEGQAATMQRLRVVRQIPLQSLRTNPRTVLGTAKVDFSPMLNNPRALFNIAQRLRTMPQHVEVHTDTTEMAEVEQGLVIHHVLGYKILPGKCQDAGAKQQLESAGVRCFQSAPLATRVQAFGTPGSPRYVSDPVKRQRAVTVYQQKEAQQETAIAAHIAELRRQFGDPSRRAQFAGKLGAAQVERMSHLTDDQLREELINGAEQRVEQTMFVPKQDAPARARALAAMKIMPDAQEKARQEQRRTGGQAVMTNTGRANQQANSAANAASLGLTQMAPVSGALQKAKVMSDQVTDLDEGNTMFLTGFTIGKDYEWKQGISVTIPWCIVGCDETYSVDAYAGFNYGFGLRFPVKTHTEYKYIKHGDGTDAANVQVSFVPINGTVDDFKAAGMDDNPKGNQIFDAKEFVAQVGADAGLDWDLPVVGSGSIPVSVELDFTQWLPEPFTNGHFTPPAPGTTTNAAPIIFDQLDLLNGFANFGVGGAQVFPAMQIGLHSDKLQFTLADNVTGQQTTLTDSGQVVPIGVGNDPARTSDVVLENPIYNVGLTVVPGIDARLFVDLAVWSDNWDWMIWFPKLTVELPPGGVDFGCHAGTNCSREFKVQGAPPPGSIKMNTSYEPTLQVVKDMTALGCTDTMPTASVHQIFCPTLPTLATCKSKAQGHSDIGCAPSKK